MRSVPSWALALVFAAVGWGGNVAADPTGGYVLTYHVTGGFVGIDDTITVSSTAKTISEQGASATLTDGDLALVTAAVEAADIPHHPGPYRCGECADQFTYDVTLAMEGKTYEAIWEDGSSAPREIFDLGTTLEDLATKSLRAH